MTVLVSTSIRYSWCVTLSSELSKFGLCEILRKTSIRASIYGLIVTFGDDDFSDEFSAKAWFLPHSNLGHFQLELILLGRCMGDCSE